MEINIGGENFFISYDDAEKLYDDLEKIFGIHAVEENIIFDDIILNLGEIGEN